MKRIILLGTAIIIFIATPLRAADIIFRVPVELVNLSPEVDKVKVVCEVQDRGVVGVGHKTIDVNKDETGVGSLIRPVSNPVVVKVDVPPFINVEKYICGFHLIAAGSSRREEMVFLSSRAPQGHPVWAQADPDKPFVRKVEGTLP